VSDDDFAAPDAAHETYEVLDLGRRNARQPKGIEHRPDAPAQAK